MTKKCLITSRSFGTVNDDAYKILAEAGYEYLKIGADFHQDEFEKLIPDYDALIIGTHPFPSEVLQNCSKLKIICKYGVGLDNIPLQQCKKQGIVVCNAPGTNSNAVADLTFGLMLAVARNIKSANSNVINGNFKPVMGIDINNKVLGLLGFGAIAKCVARRARGFGMSVLAYDPFVEELPQEFESYVKLCSFEQVLKTCDILSIHIPLTEQTKYIIAKPQLDEMKDGSILINAARGGIVNERDLYDALLNGHLFGAGLDCVENETDNIKNSLIGLDNVIVTPHIGMYSKEAINAVGIICAQNCASIEKGKDLQFRVC